MNAKTNEPRRLDSSKNEDEESGVESDELNKSNEDAAKKSSNKKESNSNEMNARQSQLISGEIIKSTINHNFNSDSDDSLVKLRKKQKEMLEAKKYLNNRRYLNESSNTLRGVDDSERDATIMFFKEEENDDARPTTNAGPDDAAASVAADESFSASSPASSNDKFTDPDLIRSTNSQKQLRTYIQNLEKKLINLRNEMKDNSSSNLAPEDNFKSKIDSSTMNLQPKQLAALSQRERTNSNESCDSMKEVAITNSSTHSYYNHEVNTLPITYSLAVLTRIVVIYFSCMYPAYK